MFAFIAPMQEIVGKLQEDFREKQPHFVSNGQQPCSTAFPNKSKELCISKHFRFGLPVCIN